jgi:hypothetical protein
MKKSYARGFESLLNNLTDEDLIDEIKSLCRENDMEKSTANLKVET